jgi:hypothetical protein
MSGNAVWTIANTSLKAAIPSAGAGMIGYQSGSKTVAAAENAPETAEFIRGRLDQPPKSFDDSEENQEDPSKPNPLLD